MASMTVKLECVIGPKFKVLVSARDNIAEIVEDQPWNELAKEALGELQELLETVEGEQIN